MVNPVGCFLEHDGRILILHRNSDRPVGDRWGAVVGKKEKGESDKEAIIREIWEETGYKASGEDLEFLGNFEGIPIFSIKLKEKFDVKLKSDEHKEFKWVNKEECLSIENVVPGLHECLELLS